jgi:hypothetical protein
MMEEGQDDFSDHLRYIIERGLMANLSGGAFKNHIVSLVQEYSRRIAPEDEGICPLFLTFCDLMIDGHFARIPESALKVLVLSKVYHNHSEQPPGLIERLSGITAPAIEEAVDYLRENSCLALTASGHRTRRGGRGTQGRGRFFQAGTPSATKRTVG